ncbi:MAG: hypothetical protein KC493_07320 [Bacteriovoracaceae bacterium]|nr:hypothetical protein [Bacteriovoracaceae bacterium]
MNLKTISLGITALSLLAVSCSSGFRRPESIEDKMSRFKAKNLGQNETPTYQVSNVNFANNGRGPASVAVEKKSTDTSISNKRLYFLSLHNQYQQLKQFVDGDSAPTLTVCPRFHTSLLKYKEAYGDSPYNGKNYTPIFNSASVDNNEYASKFPELYLPVTKDSLTPTVKDMVSKVKGNKIEETVKSAMQIHLSKTFGELKELCDYGSSDNYYIYENLLTHIQREEGFSPSNSSMTVLLKTTLVGNMALIKSLNQQSTKKASRGIASTPTAKVHYDDEVLGRMNASWSKAYFDSMVESRK